MKKRKRAFVLSGGGARGALQVGALRALLEAGIQPDLLVGSSVGAINAVFLALHGFNAEGLDNLEASWRDAAKADLLPANTTWLTVRVLFNRLRTHPYNRMREFFIAQGISPDLRFADLPGPPVVLVSADLNAYQPVYYGPHPEQSVLEGVTASTALPPWIHPLESDGHFLMDGGVVSNLPIEPAILHGATEIIALGLSNPAAIDVDAYGFAPFWAKLLTTVEERQIYMERIFAEARGVPLQLIDLRTNPPVPIWDFSHTEAMFAEGYAQTRAALQNKAPKPTLWHRLRRLARQKAA